MVITMSYLDRGMDVENQNSGLTRREMLKRGAVLGGAVAWATPAVQLIGMRPALAQTPSDTCIPQWAAEVIAFVQGDRKDGSDVLAARSNPNNALGTPGAPAQNAGEQPFFSLGFGGTLTIKFASPAYKHTGSEVLVVETTGLPYPLETATVEVSDDGLSWETIGVATNQPTSTSEFSLALVTFAFISYVRITDTSDPTPFEPEADAFDVNAIGIGCPFQE
jgi:hypothetical protein